MKIISRRIAASYDYFSIKSTNHLRTDLIKTLFIPRDKNQKALSFLSAEKQTKENPSGTFIKQPLVRQFL